MILRYSCANPECKSGSNVEGHHIWPCGQGGPDQYWNIVALCRKCHHRKGVHHRHREFHASLDQYKCSHEMRVLGFTLDEHDPEFGRRFAEASASAREGRSTKSKTGYQFNQEVSGVEAGWKISESNFTKNFSVGLPPPFHRGRNRSGAVLWGAVWMIRAVLRASGVQSDRN